MLNRKYVKVCQNVCLIRASFMRTCLGKRYSLCNQFAFLIYETEIVLFLAVLENSVLPMG